MNAQIPDSWDMNAHAHANNVAPAPRQTRTREQCPTRSNSVAQRCTHDGHHHHTTPRAPTPHNTTGTTTTTQHQPSQIHPSRSLILREPSGPHSSLYAAPCSASSSIGSVAFLPHHPTACLAACAARAVLEVRSATHQVQKGMVHTSLHTVVAVF